MTTRNQKVDTDSTEAPIKGVGCGAVVRRRALRWLESRPKEGSRRIRTRFFWWPTHLGSRWRWLEKATVEEEYTEGYSVTGHDWTPPGWYFVRFIRPPNI